MTKARIGHADECRRQVGVGRHGKREHRSEEFSTRCGDHRRTSSGAAITELATRGVGARVLVLTTYDTDGYVVPAIEAGATGYLLKDAPRDELVRAVQSAAAGESVLAPSVATTLMNYVRTPPAPDLLSPRELEVLHLVAAGNTNREAAGHLFISEATVKTHLLHIYAKLGVADRAAAVAEAFNRGLLTPVKPDRH